QHREYGNADLVVSEPGALFSGLPSEMQVWMSHGDRVEKLPADFTASAHTSNSPYAAITDGRNRLAIQFHPEVGHTPLGREILSNFLFNVCGCHGTWTPSNFIAG